MRTRDTVTLTSKRASDTRAGCTSNRPGSSVTIDDSTKDGEETCEIEAHADDVGRGVDELCNGSISIVWQEAVVGESVQSAKR